jgi:hypothetical protein
VFAEHHAKTPAEFLCILELRIAFNSINTYNPERIINNALNSAYQHSLKLMLTAD